MLTCLYPKTIWNRYTKEYVSVPCGHCDACTSLRANSWSVRCQLESKAHRYTLFGTLTYADDRRPIIDLRDKYDELCFLDGFDQSLCDSSEYVSLRNGKIPVVSVKDMQLFFKNLRNYLIRDYGIPKEQAAIRKFYVSEYGPSSFHPHYHMLLWFDSPAVAKVIKKCIYKAWQFKNPHKTLSSFLKRNRFEFVRYNASQYVAGYLNCDAHIPSILRQEPFRTFHHGSVSPSIGTSYFQPSQIQALLDGRTTKISYQKSDASKVVHVSGWRSFESRFFPRITGYASLSLRGRFALYTISNIFGRPISFEVFYSWVCDKWCSLLPSILALHKVTRTTCDDSPYTEQFRSALRRIYYTSRRFVYLCRRYDFRFDEFVRKIEEFYSRKEYDNLCKQMEEQERLSSLHFTDENLSFYPLLVDPLFAENTRKLDSDVWNDYLSQFHIKDLADVCRQFSASFKASNSFYGMMRRDNTKTRVHKDFVASHPEYQNVYLQNLLTFSL